MAKNPTIEEITAAVVASGATAEQGAASAQSITAMMSTNPERNDFLPEFNNRILQKWNDTHSDATIYDRFRTYDDRAPTLQAVVYESIAPVDFSFKTDISALADDEKCFGRKIPDVHSVLRTINVQNRFKTTVSRLELDKIQDGQAVSEDDIIANLGASYSDDRTVRFETLVNSIAPAKNGDEIFAMETLADVSKFIQAVKKYAREFKRVRTDKYNAYVNPADDTAKADTKMYPDQRPVVLISPEKMYQIEGDYYATLYQIQQALPDVEFIEVDGLTDNKFAVMIDPRVILWSRFQFEFTREHICGRELGEDNVYLFAKDIMAEYTCFNRMIFRTATSAAKMRAK